MLRAHRIRLNPTPEQRNYFMRAAGVARYVWNWALTEYKGAKELGETADWNALKIKFNALKREKFPFVFEVTKCAAEQAIADLRQSISTYYKAKKRVKKIHFPSYRRRSKRIGGFGLNNNTFSVDGFTARIPKLGEVNMAEELRFEGKIMSGRIKERAGRWYLTVVVEVESQRVSSARGSVGIDFGLCRFATPSKGEVCETQAYFRRSEGKLKKLQRGLARKKKGSRNRAKWKLRVARLHERIRNQRADFLHEFTHRVTKAFAIVSVEDLNLKGLQQTPLAKSFNDAGIGEAIRQLSYKATWLQKVDRFFASSKLCSACGAKNDQLMLSDRIWTCVCGAVHDRDLNAAQNIEQEGLRLLSLGSGYVETINSPVDERALAHASA